MSVATGDRAAANAPSTRPRSAIMGSFVPPSVRVSRRVAVVPSVESAIPALVWVKAYRYGWSAAVWFALWTSVAPTVFGMNVMCPLAPEPLRSIV